MIHKQETRHDECGAEPVYEGCVLSVQYDLHDEAEGDGEGEADGDDERGGEEHGVGPGEIGEDGGGRVCLLGHGVLLVLFFVLCVRREGVTYEYNC